MMDIPKTEHYAIIEETSRSVYHEGDERSRTNPGHGYPAYTEEIKSISYRSFMTVAEVEKYISIYPNKSFTVLKVQPMTYKREIKVVLS